jgi:hypothetical protein
MDLHAVIGDWHDIAGIPGSRSDDVLQVLADNTPPFEDDEAQEAAAAVLMQIVSGGPIEAPDFVADGVEWLYHAFGNWPEHFPHLECDDADMLEAQDAIVGLGLHDRVKALDFSRSSPVLPSGQSHPGARFAFMTSEEIAACGSCIKTQDWSSLPAGAAHVLTALAAWIDEAARRPNLGLFITLREDGEAAEQSGFLG